jgi:cell shape-determining protein MreC
MEPPSFNKDLLDYIKDLEQAKEIIRKLTEKLKDYKDELEEIKKLFIN